MSQDALLRLIPGAILALDCHRDMRRRLNKPTPGTGGDDASDQCEKTSEQHWPPT
jgi:hypothetical protein